MFKALVTRDGKEEHLSVYDTKKETPYTAICPGCKALVRANRGAQKQHYWSHIPGAECSYGAGMTQWHYEWQQFFNGTQDVLVEPYDLFPNNRPDVLLSFGYRYLVVEFQNSPITAETIQQREAAYVTDMGSMVWVVNVNSRHFSVTEKPEGARATWLYASKVWDAAKCPVIFANGDHFSLYYFNPYHRSDFHPTWHHRKSTYTIAKDAHWLPVIGAANILETTQTEDKTEPQLIIEVLNQFALAHSSSLLRLQMTHAFQEEMARNAQLERVAKDLENKQRQERIEADRVKFFADFRAKQDAESHYLHQDHHAHYTAYKRHLEKKAAKKSSINAGSPITEKQLKERTWCSEDGFLKKVFDIS